MDDQRPDPDELLKKLKEAEAPSAASPRGRLKIFLGYAAGVGKTFAMLEAAHQARNRGEDVTVGWIEPHARPETLAQLGHLEMIPPAILSYKGITLRDLDLDACLSRHPKLLLVDELAHSNAPGSRHTKRWQDIEELLAQGIDVYTSLNIQHLESMGDVVARFSGIQVQETIPDQFFDGADETEVIDIPPEELIDRLNQGKIYSPAQARKALQSFFKRQNLLALREITLRRAAQRIGQDVDSARLESHEAGIWPVRERLLVSVSPSPTSQDLVRSAARLAQTLKAELLCLYIETPRNRVLDKKSQHQLEVNLALAERLGAQTALLQGEDVASLIVEFARLRNVTKIVLGKNRDPGWLRFWKRTIGDQVTRLSGDIDIYIITGRPQKAEKELEVPPARKTFQVQPFLVSTLVCAGFTALAGVLQFLGLSTVNLVLTQLLGVVVSAFLFGFFPSLYTSVLTVLLYNFFFTPPVFTLAVSDPQNYLVFLFLLIVGTVIGTLTDRIREQTQVSRRRELRMETLHLLTRELAAAVSPQEMAQAASEVLTRTLGLPVTLLLPEGSGTLPQEDSELYSPKDQALLAWVRANGKKAGWGTHTLRESELQVWPLGTPSLGTALMVLRKTPETSELKPEHQLLLESAAVNIALVLEKFTLLAETQAAAALIESEKTRSTLLHSLSHDLRTPLTVISGTVSTLAESAAAKLNAQERQLLSQVGAEAATLVRQVENILSLTRLTDGVLKPDRQWLPGEDLVLTAVERFRVLYPDRKVEIRVPDHLELVYADPVLAEQCLVNFLENAALHGRNPDPAQDRIVVEALPGEQTWRFAVIDRGPGVPAEDRDRIFGQFIRGNQHPDNPARSGIGLGLAIVKAAVELHGGQTGVEDHPGGGASFWFTLPRPSVPPELPGEEL